MEGINAFDRSVMEWIQTHLHNRVSDTIFPILTHLGEAGAVWLLLAACLFVPRKTRKTAACLLLSILLSIAVGEAAVKNLVCRPRPFVLFPSYTALLVSPPAGYSFPSGHSSTSFAGGLCILHFRRRWGIPALLLAGGIAFSRLFLFVHWPTDVLAGIALGTAAALLTLLLLKPLLDRIPFLREEGLSSQERH